MTLAVDDPRHGTKNGYGNLGCRCEPCRKAATAAWVEWSHRTGLRRSWDEYLSSLPPMRHGLASSYNKRGCRCDECREAANTARREHRKRPNVAQHGLPSSYSNGCRCAECLAAHNAYQRNRRRRKARPLDEIEDGP